MAFVLKYPTSRYWIASFYDARGRLHRRTTRETDKKRAILVAQQYERAAKGKGNPQRVRQILSEFLQEHFNGGEELPFSSVSEYCKRWLSARKPETVSGTYLRYGAAVSKFLDFLGPQAKQGIDIITRTQVTAFRDRRLSQASTATANMDLKIIRRIFRSARLDGYLLQDPAEAVKAVKNRGTIERRPFTLDELRSVLDVAAPEWQSLVKFGLYTGQRLGDLALLTWNQIDLQREEIRMVTRKTGKRLIIPIAAPLHEHILNLQAADNPKAPVHPIAFGIMQAQCGRVGTLSNQFGEILVAAGLRQSYQNRGVGRSGKHQGSELSFHSLRHTSVSLLKDAGVPDAVVMALVGHESMAMSQRYTHVGKEALSKAAQTLPEI